nr:hypothetical protein CFP56_09596 [Quercus suber]
MYLSIPDLVQYSFALKYPKKKLSEMKDEGQTRIYTRLICKYPTPQSATESSILKGCFQAWRLISYDNVGDRAQVDAPKSDRIELAGMRVPLLGRGDNIRSWNRDSEPQGSRCATTLCKLQLAIDGLTPPRSLHETLPRRSPRFHTRDDFKQIWPERHHDSCVLARYADNFCR